MPDPNTPDDSKDIVNRSHTPINPVESAEEMILPEGESLSSDSSQSHVSEVSGTNEPESSLPMIEESEKTLTTVDDSRLEPVVENIKENPTTIIREETKKQLIQQNKIEERAYRTVPAIDEYGMPIPQKSNNVAKP
jgi:hypothetical protein